MVLALFSAYAWNIKGRHVSDVVFVFSAEKCIQAYTHPTAMCTVKVNYQYENVLISG